MPGLDDPNKAESAQRGGCSHCKPTFVVGDLVWMRGQLWKVRSIVFQSSAHTWQTYVVGDNMPYNSHHLHTHIPS